MKAIYNLLTIICAIALFTITPSGVAQNTWTQKANFGGTGHYGSVGFSIGTKGYIGTGNDSTGCRNDFWEYDPSSNSWSQKANFGGVARGSAVGFSIGTKGYIGTGQAIVNNTTIYYNDFWEYNPSTNTWTRKANFGGGGRSAAVGFSIGVKGYIGTGENGIPSSTNDFWEYDPSTNIWTQKANFGGTARMGATGFSIGATGYLGTGYTNTYRNDFWEYDPSSDTWSQKANFGGMARWAASGFSIGANGYIGTGDCNLLLNDFWEYDPSSDSWTQKANFGGTSRDWAVAFSIGTLGYMGTGWGNVTAGKDFWEYNNSCIPPAPPTNTTPASNLTLCSGHSTVLSASGTGTIGWYNAPSGGSWLGSGTSYTTPVLTTNTTYYVQDSTCAASSTRTSIAVTVNPLPSVFNVTGGGSYCSGSAGLAIGLSGSVVGINYTLYNGIAVVTTLPGTGTALNFGLQTSTGIYTVAASNATTSCTNNMNGSATITINPLPTPSITGPVSVCANSTGNVYITQAGMTNYVWSVSPGGIIIAGGSSASNTVTVTWNTAGVQTVTVNYSNVYGCQALLPTIYSVTVNSLPVPTISGSASTCAGSTGNVYNTQAGMTNYIWTVSAGGTITAGGSSLSNTVTVTWNAVGVQTVNVNFSNVNGCQALLPTVYSVTVNALPVPTISGAATACAGSTGNVYTTQAGMTSYIWTVSPGGTVTSGGTSTDNSVTVTWNSAGAQSVSVNYTNSNGCTGSVPVVRNVTVNTLPIPTITGQTSLCINSGYYNYTTEAGMLNYAWTVSPGGLILYGAGTNQVQIFWINSGLQTISVTYTNGAGCNPLMPAVLNIMVNPLPGAAGTITGIHAVCAETNGVAYSVAPIPYTTTYVWTLPPNATIASGFGMNSITVDFAANASSGDIIVYGNNLCGNGSGSPAFYVNVTPIPPTPVVTNTGDTLISSVIYGNQWYFEGSLLPVDTGQTCVATQTGRYWDIVTKNGCISDTSNHKLIVVTGIETHSGISFNVYPVPSNGQLNLSITASRETFSIIIYNTLGIKVYEETAINVNGSMQKMIDLQSFPEGIYTVIFENSHNRVVKKVILKK